MKNRLLEPNTDDLLVTKSLYFANSYSSFAYFNPNNYRYPFEPFQHLLLIGSKYNNASFQEGFDHFDSILKFKNEYVYGHLNYDLKNELEDLDTTNPPSITFPLLAMHVPEIAIRIGDFGLEIIAEEAQEILNKIKNIQLPKSVETRFKFKPLVNKTQYLENVNHIKNHVVEGDVYELNYCQEFIAEGKLKDPINCYLELNKKSPAPFSTLFKNKDQFIIGTSPERFLKKSGRSLISQPIKGTIRRGLNSAEDQKLKFELRHNEKEMAENMMIVDLVRNDLSRSCEVGSVKVDEMFGVYSFPNWHQMISTVSGELQKDCTAIEAIKNAFPMGSMTGAPKIKVMQLIEQYENSARGAYSGATGYFLPNGDFDFNVTIRSLIYDDNSEKCSFHVGGAITYDSDPEMEYQECLLKASAFASMFEIEVEN